MGERVRIPRRRARVVFQAAFCPSLLFRRVDVVGYRLSRRGRGFESLLWLLRQSSSEVEHVIPSALLIRRFSLRADDVGYRTLLAGGSIPPSQQWE